MSFKRMPIFFILLVFLGLALALGGGSACQRKILYSKDREMKSVSRLFNTSADEAFRAGREAVTRLGYRVERENIPQKTLQTGWISTKANSHYVDLFDHQDYGTVGAYYRLELRVEESEGKALVEVSAPVRSIVGRMKSSQREEKKVLQKIADLVRREDFELSNVGAEE